MNANAFSQKDYENKTAFPLQQNKPNQTQFQTRLGLFLQICQAQAKEGFHYIFISTDRLEKIRERQKIKKWNSRSDVINNMGRDFAVIRRRASVTECTLHDLRRSAITNWASQLPIQALQQLAGHSDIYTTGNYYLTVRSEAMVSARILAFVNVCK